MTIQIRYNKGKVIQALRYHFISRMEIKVLLILVNVFALLSAILLGFKMIRPMPFLVSSFMWFVLMLSFWFLLPWLVYRRNSTFKENIDVTLQDRGMLLDTARGMAEWQYGKFQYYIETPHFFHLYINDKSFFLLPKDACGSEQDVLALREVLDNKIGKK